MYLNEATLLNNVRIRYTKDKIYVSILCSLPLLNVNHWNVLLVFHIKAKLKAAMCGQWWLKLQCLRI